MLTKQAPEAAALDESGNLDLRERHSGGAIAGSVLALLSAQAISWTASIVGLAIVPRFLGPDDFGVLATALGISGVVITIAACGTGPHAIKGAARDPAHAATLFVQMVALRSAIRLALSLPLFFYLPRMFESPPGTAVAVLALVSGLFGLISDAAVAGMQANHLVARPAILRAVLLAGTQLIIGALLIMGNGLLTVAVVTVIGAGLVAIGTTALFWRRFGGHIDFHIAGVRSMAAGGRPYLAFDLSLMIYGRVDQLMLASMVGTSAVGLYAFGIRFMSLPAFIPAIIGSATYPTLSAAAHRDGRQFRSVLTGALRIAVMSSFPMAAGLVVLSSDLTRALGGAAYEQAQPVVLLLALVVPVAAVDTILATAMQALDRQGAWARMGWIAAVFNPAANLIAIPLAVSMWGIGAIGTSFTTLLTEVLMTSGAAFLMLRYIERDVVVSAVRVFGATAIMTVVVITVRAFVGPWPAIPIGAATYGLAAFALGVIQPHDVQLARATVAKRLGRSAPQAA